MAGGQTTPPDVAWASIQKPGSWSLRYPSTWRVQRLDNECSGSVRGAIVTNTSFQFTPRFEGPCRWRRFGRWIMAGFPDDGVALVIEPLSWFPLGGPDYPPVSMPPAIGDLHLTAGLTGGPWALFAPLPHFPGDSYGYEVRMWIGRDAQGGAIALLQDALRSVRVVRGAS